MSSWLALAYVGNDLRTEDQSDTADYENIGHVEGGPMRGTDIEIEEICHGSNSHAVHDVAERASEDQTVGNRFYAVPGAQHHDSEPGTNSKRKHHKAPPRRTSEKPKDHAIVTVECKIEAGKNSNPGTQSARIRDNEGFYDLIDCESRQGGSYSSG